MKLIVYDFLQSTWNDFDLNIFYISLQFKESITYNTEYTTIAADY